MNNSTKTEVPDPSVTFTTEKVHGTDSWQAVRIQAAIAAMQGLISNKNYTNNIARISMETNSDFVENITKDAVELADDLIKKLKGE